MDGDSELSNVIEAHRRMSYSSWIIRLSPHSRFLARYSEHESTTDACASTILELELYTRLQNDSKH